MSKRLKGILTSSCLILVLLILIFFITRQPLYPSVIASSCVEASNVEISVELQLSEQEKKIVCAVDNHNDYAITSGVEYYLEKEKDGKWYEVVDKTGKRTNEKAWNEIAQLFPANKRSGFEISLDEYQELSAGNYRVVKYVSLENTSKNKDTCYIFVAPFEVKE